mgnify:CR=1 FL=1
MHAARNPEAEPRSAPSSPFWHVGYPKSASTTLQVCLFDKHPDINNFGIYPIHNVGFRHRIDEVDSDCAFVTNPGLRELYRMLVEDSGTEYDPMTARKLKKNIESDVERKGKATVFSVEGLTSVFFGFPRIEARARRLHDLWPDANVFFLIRNQFDIIQSQYRDWPFDPRRADVGEPVPIREWLEIDMNLSNSFVKSLLYSDVVKCYADLFGRKNVTVFLFEQLVKDTSGFAQDLSAYLGINAQITEDLLSQEGQNRGVSKYYNLYRRLRRRFFPEGLGLRSILPNRLVDKAHEILRRGDKEKHELGAVWTKRLHDLYANSNAELAEEFDLDLRRYDYPL